MSRKKYEYNEAMRDADYPSGIFVGEDHGDFALKFSGESYFENRDDAEAALQEYANAIADSVHGDELAELRERIATALPIAMRLEDATDADPHVAKGELVTCAAALLAALKGPMT